MIWGLVLPLYAYICLAIGELQVINQYIVVFEQIVWDNASAVDVMTISPIERPRAG